MTMFQIEYDRLMKLTKANIIAEGVQRGFWASTPEITASLLKSRDWNKKSLARYVANRIVRMELRDYPLFF